MNTTTSILVGDDGRAWRGITNAVSVDEPFTGAAGPDPIRTLWTASCCGILLAAVFRLPVRFDLPLKFLFVKEGFFEDVTFVLELAGAALCGIAAFRMWRRQRDMSERFIALAYGACALMLFVVGMEEISWGQQLLHFKTPDEWARINHQQETTLHNLVDKSTLRLVWKIVAVAFLAAVFALCIAARTLKTKFLRAIAPHPSLVPLAIVTTYAGLRLHPEMIELLMSIFFAFYTYRVFVITRPYMEGSRL